MAFAAGVLIAIALIWAFCVFFFDKIRDIPLSSGSIRGRIDSVAEEDRIIEAQRRLARVWRTRLWPVPLLCLIVAAVLLSLAAAN